MPDRDLADFDPEHGHRRAPHGGEQYQRCITGRCGCAQELFELAVTAAGALAAAARTAEDAHSEAARMRWFMAHRYDRADSGDTATILAVYEEANPDWIDWQLAGRDGDAPPMYRQTPPDARMLTAGGVMVTPTGEASSARELMDAMPPVRRFTGPTT